MHGVQATAKAAPATSGPPDPARLISESGCHSLLRMGTNGLATKTAPIVMISAPEILSSATLWSLSVWASPAPVQPRATKITVNERQKIAAGQRIFEVGA